MDWYDIIVNSDFKIYAIPGFTTFLVIIIKILSGNDKHGSIFKRENFTFGLQLIVTAIAIYLIYKLDGMSEIVEVNKDGKLIFNELVGLLFTVLGSLIFLIGFSILIRLYGWIDENNIIRPSTLVGVWIPNIIGIIWLILVVNLL